MIGGTVSITGNNVIADMGTVAEVPLLVLRDTAASVVQNYSGNKVNGIEVTLDQKAFTHDSSPSGNLWLFYYNV